jgi:hypothetical protein
MSALGRSSWNLSSLKEGMAITTRIRIGRIVHATSSPAWCVVREGTGFFDSRKRQMA